MPSTAPALVDDGQPDQLVVVELVRVVRRRAAAAASRVSEVPRSVSAALRSAMPSKPQHQDRPGPPHAGDGQRAPVGRIGAEHRAGREPVVRVVGA